MIILKGDPPPDLTLNSVKSIALTPISQEMFHLVVQMARGEVALEGKEKFRVQSRSHVETSY